MRRIALPLFAVLLAASACDRGRFDTLERRVEALEKKDTERAPTVVADAETMKSLAVLQTELAEAKAGRDAADAKLAALGAQLVELQQQHDALQQQLGKGGTTAGTGGSATSTGPVGIKACDEYIEKYTRCIEDKIPEAARKSMREAMDMSAKAWREAASGPAREGLATACEAALDAAAQATKSLGCEW